LGVREREGERVREREGERVCVREREREGVGVGEGEGERKRETEVGWGERLLAHIHFVCVFSDCCQDFHSLSLSLFSLPPFPTPSTFAQTGRSLWILRSPQRRKENRQKREERRRRNE
jgi:hypothetical protein